MDSKNLAEAREAICAYFQEFGRERVLAVLREGEVRRLHVVITNTQANDVGRAVRALNIIGIFLGRLRPAP